MGLSVADITRSSGCEYDPAIVEKILSLARYNSNRLAHTAGASLHVSRTRHRDPAESGIDMLASSIRAAEQGDFDHAHTLVTQVGHLFALTRRTDLLCEVQIAENRIQGMERSSLVRETRMRAEVDATLDLAERRARALEIEPSKSLLRQAAALTAVDNFPRRDSLQRRFNGVSAALEAAELVIKGDDQLALAWDCVQRDELSEAQRYLDEAQVAYASTDLRTKELRALRDALSRKRAEEQRIRGRFRALVAQSREAIKDERFIESALLIEEARDALSQWTEPEGKELILVSRLTNMIAKTYQNKPLFEAYCAFDEKNLSGQGNRALMMDFNEYLHLLQDLGVLEQKTAHKANSSKTAQLKAMTTTSGSSVRMAAVVATEVEEKPAETISKGRAFQIELCQQCTYQEIKDSNACKVAKADIYEIFRAVNFRSVLQLHRGNINADNDMSSLNYVEYQLCMLRLGKLLGVPVTDHGTSPLFLKDLKDLDELKDFFVEAKLKVRERLLSNGENYVSSAKNAMQECAFSEAREQLQLAITQYQRVDDEQIMRHYLQNCKRLFDLIDREEKKEMARKSELALQAEGALERVKTYLEEFDLLGCRFDENKFKICIAEAVSARKCYKSAALYGIYQRDSIQKLQNRIMKSEARILELRAALAQAQVDLQQAEHLMEVYNFTEIDANPANDVRLSRTPSFVVHKDLSEEIFQTILMHLETADTAITLAKDPSTRISYDLLLKRYVSFAKNFVRHNSDSGLSFLELARKNFDSSLAARNNNWKAAFEHLHHAKKAIEHAQKFISKALLARCAVPYFEEEGVDIFHSKFLTDICCRVTKTEEIWHIERVNECAEGSRLLNECKSFIDIGDFELALHSLSLAKSVLKGDNSWAVTSMESELEGKRLEDETWTKALLSKASKCLMQAVSATSSISSEQAYNDCEAALEVLSQIRLIDQKPKAFTLRQEVISSKSNIVQAAFFSFDTSLARCSELLDRVLTVLYELDFEKAESIISEVRDQVRTLDIDGILRIPGSGTRRAADFEAIRARIEQLTETIGERDQILQSIRSQEDKLGRKMLERAHEFFQESALHCISLKGFEFEFAKDLFELGKRLIDCSEADQAAVAKILEIIEENNQNEQKLQISREEVLASVEGEVQGLIHQEMFLDAQLIITRSNYGQGISASTYLVERFRNLNIACDSLSIQFLERIFSNLHYELICVIKELANADYKGANSRICSLLTILRPYFLDEATFAITAASDAEALKFILGINNAREKAICLQGGLCVLVQIEDEIIQEMSAYVTYLLDQVHVSCEKYEYDLAESFLTEAHTFVQNILPLTSLKNAAEGERMRIKRSTNLLLKSKSCLEEDASALASISAVTGRNLLHDCCISGDSDRLQRVFRLNPEINCRDGLGLSPLHHAATNGHHICVDFLCCYKADVNLRDVDGCSPLLCAVRKGCASCVQVLLRYGADPFMSDFNGLGPLHYCALNDNSDIIEQILWYDISSESDELWIRVEQQLLAKESRGYTPAMLATICGSRKPVEALLSSGAYPFERDNEGLTCFHLAAKVGAVDAISALRPYLSDVDCPNTSTGRSALMLASEFGMIEAMRAIIDFGGDVNFQDRELRTPLHVACFFRGSEEEISNILRLLLNSGANIAKKDSFGFTPVQLCCSCGNTEAMKFYLAFIQAHAEFDSLMYDLFYIAVFRRQHHILEMLLEHNNTIPLDISHSGMNLFHAAILDGDPCSMQLILRRCPSAALVRTATELSGLQLSKQDSSFLVGESPSGLVSKCMTLANAGKADFDVVVCNNMFQIMQAVDASCTNISNALNIELAAFSLDVIFPSHRLCKGIRSGPPPHSPSAEPCANAVRFAAKIEEEWSELRKQIEIAERLERDRILKCAQQMRADLFMAKKLALVGRSLECFEVFEKVSCLVESEGAKSYDVALLDQCRSEILIPLVEMKTISAIRKESKQFEPGMYDVRTATLDLSFLGSCWTFLDSKVGNSWRTTAIERSIKGECRVLLEEILLQVEQSLDGTANDPTLCWTERLQHIGIAISNACDLINDQAIKSDLCEFKKTVSALKYEIEAISAEFKKPPSISDNGLGFEIFFAELNTLEEIGNLFTLLMKVKSRLEASSWIAIKWAKYVIAKTEDHYIYVKSLLPKLESDKKIEISGSNNDCSSVSTSYESIQTVLMKFERELSGCQELIERSIHTISQREVQTCLEIIVDSVPEQVQAKLKFEADEQTLKIIESFNKAFSESEYAECLELVKNGIETIHLSQHEDALKALRRFVVCEFYLYVMVNHQRYAEEHLERAEEQLQVVLNALKSEETLIQEQNLQQMVSLLEDAFNSACKSLQRIKDEREHTRVRVTILREKLEQIAVEMIRREVKAQIRDLIAQVQSDEIFRIESLKLESVLQIAENDFKDNKFELCFQHLSCAKAAVMNSTARTRLQELYTFERLDQMISASVTAWEAQKLFTEAERCLEHSQKLFEQRFIEESAAFALSSIENFKLSNYDVSLHTYFFARYIEHVANLIFSMYVGWLSSVCVLAISIIESEINKVGIILGQDIKRLFHDQLVYCSQNSNQLPMWVLSQLESVRSFAEFIPTSHAVHKDLLDLAEVGKYMLLCSQTSEKLKDTNQAISNCKDQDTLFIAKSMLNQLRDSVHSAVKSKPQCEDHGSYVDIDHYVQQLDCCEVSLKSAEESIELAKLNCSTQWSEATLAFESSKYAESLEHLDRCEVFLAATAKLQQVEMKGNIETLRAKARYHLGVRVLNQKIDEISQQLQSFLERKDFSRAFECADLLAQSKQQLLEMESREIKPGVVERNS